MPRHLRNYSLFLELKRQEKRFLTLSHSKVAVTHPGTHASRSSKKSCCHSQNVPGKYFANQIHLQSVLFRNIKKIRRYFLSNLREV